MHRTRDEVVPLPPPFEIVLRGFDRQQVLGHVDALTARIVRIETERDAALQRSAGLHEKLEQLRRQAADAATEVDRLQRSPLGAATARIQRMLQMAEDEAAELTAAAERESTSLRGNARAEADRLLAETSQRCERLEADSATRCRDAEQQSEREIAHRETATDSWIRDYQTRSVAALHLIMKMAAERLSNRVAKVTRQVTAARALRSEVTGQLSEVHRMLVDALGVVDQPTPAEHAERSE